jgi:hypothetical protein
VQVAWQQAMDRMLAGFVQWATAVKQALGAQHFWCDAIDPLTGCPLVRHRCSMHSSGLRVQGTPYSTGVSNQRDCTLRWARKGTGDGVRLQRQGSFWDTPEVQLAPALSYTTQSMVGVARCLEFNACDAAYRLQE